MELKSLTLAVIPEGWRLFNLRKADQAFLKFSEKIFARDDYTCQFCGFKSTKHQEITNLDHDYRNNKANNLATSCPFCAQCSFLEAVGKSEFGGGTLIYLPEMTQAELNGLCHALFTSIAKDSNEWNGYNFIRVRIIDDSSLSKVRIIVKGPDGARSDLKWPGQLSSPWQYVVELYNFKCEWDTAEITVYATDDALLRNRAINRYPAEIPPRLCETPTEVPPDGTTPTPTPTPSWTPPLGNPVEGVRAIHWKCPETSNLFVSVNIIEGYENLWEPTPIEGLMYYHEDGTLLKSLYLSSPLGTEPYTVWMDLLGHPVPNTVFVVLLSEPYNGGAGDVYGYVNSVPGSPP